MTLAFGISYLFRAGFNSLQALVGYDNMDDFKNYGGDMNIWWSVFLLVFHIVGELIPVLILFMYQFRSN